MAAPATVWAPPSDSNGALAAGLDAGDMQRTHLKGAPRSNHVSQARCRKPSNSHTDILGCRIMMS